MKQHRYLVIGLGLMVLGVVTTVGTILGWPTSVFAVIWAFGAGCVLMAAVLE